MISNLHSARAPSSAGIRVDSASKRYLEFRRGTAGTRLLVEFGLEREVPLPQLLKGSQLNIEHLADPGMEISVLQELRVMKNLLAALRGVPALGLEVGKRYRLSNFGIWGYALMTCATCRDALEMASRYVPLTYALSPIRQELLNDQVVFQFPEPDLSPALRRFAVERAMAGVATVLQQLIGPNWRLHAFDLKAEKGRAQNPAANAASFGGIAPNFRGTSYRLAFDSAYLDQALPLADATTFAQCERMCAQLVERRRTHLGAAQTVEQLMQLASGSELPTLETYARLVNASPRTLKRRLHLEGTSFRALRAKVRSQQAITLVGETTLALTTIAQRLGYADLSSFSQTFKRWFGMSPAAFRAGHLERGSSAGPT